MVAARGGGTATGSRENSVSSRRSTMMHARMLIEKDGSRRVPLDEPITIGSAPSSRIVVNAPGVEVTHALVKVLGRTVVVEAQHEHAPIHVNGLPAMRRTLATGDTIEIGGKSFVYQELASEERPETKGRTTVMHVKPVPKGTGTIPDAAPSRSSGRMKSSTSGRLNSASTRIASERMRELQKEAVVRGPHADETVANGLKRVRLGMYIGGAVLGVLALVTAVALAWPQVQAWRARNAEASRKSQEQSAALERLAGPGPKDSADLPWVLPKLKTCRTWSDVEALLGTPHETFEGSVLLFTPDMGSFEKKGASFKAYYLAIPDRDPKKDTVVSVLLFETNGTDSFEYDGPQAIARMALPPLPHVPKPPEGEGQADLSPPQ